jgi:peptidoglycan/LPS O-acetylase OafA/YrhL
MGRIKELDGLRAIAILGVLTAHFVPPTVRLRDLLGLGWSGVDLFFAISGFLITGILIGLRRKEAAFRTFYWRRTLRIFPPYYLALVLMLLLALAHGEHLNYREIVRHSLFLSSAKPGLIKLAFSRLLFKVPRSSSAELQHFQYTLLQFKDCFEIYWSLSVEELFYLLWAPIVLKGSRRMVMVCSVAPLLVCPILRGLAHTTPHIAESFGFVFRFDSLAAGACVAFVLWGVDHGYFTGKLLDRGLIAIIIVSSLALFLLVTFCGAWRGVDVRTTLAFSIFGFSLLAMGSAALVGAFVRGSGHLGLLSNTLRSRGAVYLGTISYTMYLIHLPTFVVVQLVMVRVFGADIFPSNRGLAILSGVLASTCAVLLAGLSWNYIEGPIMRLKDVRFPVKDAAIALPVESDVDRSAKRCA